MEILVISDPHYINKARHTCPVEQRRCRFGLLLLRKAIRRLQDSRVKPDLIILLGDMVDDGNASGAQDDLAAMSEEVFKHGIPVLAVHGNHDGDQARYESVFKCKPGLHEIGGYGFLLFNDKIGEGDLTERTQQDLALVDETTRAFPELPLIAVQHNPLLPRINAEYPYTLANAEQVADTYGKADVLLSLSGHYHKGQPPHKIGKITFVTAPGITEYPYRFLHVSLTARLVAIHEHRIAHE